jgi:hypothetical protein
MCTHQNRHGEGGGLYRYEHFQIVISHSIVYAIFEGTTTQSRTSCCEIRRLGGPLVLEQNTGQPLAQALVVRHK